jgi:hypothetical protein
MAITSIKTGSSFTNLVKYNDFLAGNPAFSPSSYESIASATGTGSSGTITFSSIPSTYKHLQIRYTAKIASGGGTDIVPIILRFNGNTSAVYRSHYLTGNGTTASASADGSAQTGGYILISDSGTASNIQGVGIVDVIDYASSTKNKTVRVFQGMDKNASGGVVRLSSTGFYDTTAISSIDFITLSGSFNTTTEFALYGIKG